MTESESGTYKQALSLMLSDAATARRMVKDAARAGFDGLEPTFHPEGFPRWDCLLEDARALRQWAMDAGLALPSLRGGPVFWKSFCAPDPKQREATVSRGREALDCLCELGGNVLLVVPGQQSEGVDPDDQYRWLVELARRLGDEARARDVQIGLENVEGRFPPTLAMWQKLLGEIDHPHVGCYLDVGNVVRLGLGDPVEWITALAPWIRRVHVKGARPGDETVLPVGGGAVDWPAVGMALQRIGYRGWLVTEPLQPAEVDSAFVAACFQDLDAVAPSPVEETE